MSANLPDSLGPVDRAAYAIFASQAQKRRHDRDRRAFRGTNLTIGFDLFIARLYAVATSAAIFLSGTISFVFLVLPDVVVSRLWHQSVDFATRFMPDGVNIEAISVVILTSELRIIAALGSGAIIAAGMYTAVLYAGGRYLQWRITARRTDIDRTLPSAVRYLNVLASGSDTRHEMLRRVADTDAYGQTAVSIRKILNTATMTGNIDEGLRRVARDTPAQDTLAPFLLKFREHADQGADALRNYLALESRMLRYQQDSDRRRAEGFLELLAELFVVLLVLPTLVVIVLSVMSILTPSLAVPIETPIGKTTPRALITYASAGFILTVGLGVAGLVSALRPTDQQVTYARPSSLGEMTRTAFTNPASAAVIFLITGALGIAFSIQFTVNVLSALLVGYICYAIPVGLIAVRRARVDDAKDHELKDFVHAISGHVELGQPFPDAVEEVAKDVDLGPLDSDVADLAANLRLTTPHAGIDTNLRTAALDRFVTRVGTPLAEQTVGLVTGALDAGSDTGVVFETLQAEIGRLYHDKQTLRSGMMVYVAVGWTTALLVVGITVATATQVFAGFERLATMSDISGVAVGEAAINITRDQFRLYVTTQATMLAAGWFAGVASRGRYEALLHSGMLVSICHVIFAGTGVI
jgi:flagellar protein FlaJ